MMPKFKNSLHSSPNVMLIITTVFFFNFSLLKAHGQIIRPNTANIHPTSLSADPLYAQGNGQKPTLTLALSLEYPTVGAQYRDEYSNTKKYIGYFDVNSCYEYINHPAEDERRFKRTSSTDSLFGCGGTGFSGNFMNWASGSAVDILRYGLTGGDRIKDTDNLTVLQRAVLYNDPIQPREHFWNNPNYFPEKIIPPNLAVGALPNALRGSHTGNIYISNCLNRIFFADKSTYDPVNKTSTSSCSNPIYENSLGASSTDGSKIAAGSRKLSTGMFFTRVEVCESNSGILIDPRTDLCQKYPNGNFKPVGALQKYSDRVRVAIFSYSNDNNAIKQRYGGVLRAPMSYVGPRAFDSSGLPLPGPNPEQEWNSDNGIFFPNPKGDTRFNISGAINYLNTIGRITGYEGIYKNKDPISELYYESLRYLQGLQPTTAAVSNLDQEKYGGFPLYDTWTDPFEGGSNTQNYACLRNSILVAGDVYSFYDKSLPGNDQIIHTPYVDDRDREFIRTSEVDLSENIPNFKDWTRIVGGFESNSSHTYSDGNDEQRNTQTLPAPSNNSYGLGLETKPAGSGVVPTGGYGIAGAAYWAHTHDIRGKQWKETNKQRPGMRITTYVLDVNEGNTQSVFNTRKNSQLYLAAKYGGFNDIDGDGNPFTPNSSVDPKGNRHWVKDTSPANEPDPKTYFLASDSEAFLKAIDDIFIDATQAASSIARPGLSSSKVTTIESYVYQADFDPEFWAGDIKRRTLSLTNTGVLNMSPEAQSPSAAARLDAIPSNSLVNRKIFIGKSNKPRTGAIASTFTWNAIENSLKQSLRRSTSTGPLASPSMGEARLNYIRGDRSLEGISFRKRKSRLGDIINSGVVHSGVPTTIYADNAYRDFYATHKNRTPAIFAGANDGMLHAFNANTMEELFAYIPSWLGPKLSILTLSDYNSSRHTSYVDGTPEVAEAQVNGNWKTILVSGTGAGGQGVFALDVTTPDNFTENNLLWEFTDEDDSSLGNVVGQPRILKLRTNAAQTNQAATYKWFAVVASGVNNYVEDGNSSRSGEPALFLLDLSKSRGSDWQLGTNYFKISFPLQNDRSVGTIDANGTSKASGAINFQATANADGSVEYIYIGDLHGQMWKLDMNKSDLSVRNANSWNLNKISHYQSNNNAKPFFIAKDAINHVQPISMAPTIAYGPTGSYIIAFGTGKYLEATDNSIQNDTQIQSFYVLYDAVGTQIDTEGHARFNGTSRLQKLTVTASNEGFNISNPGFIWVPPRNTDTLSRKAGWYFNYPAGGNAGAEQQVTNALLVGKEIRFNSTLPPNASTSACSGGSSRSYSINLSTGNGKISNLNAAAMGAPLLLHMGSTYGESGAAGERYRTDNVGVINPSSEGLGDASNIRIEAIDILAGRLSWRQINNYKELKNKPWNQ